MELMLKDFDSMGPKRSSEKWLVENDENLNSFLNWHIGFTCLQAILYFFMSKGLYDEYQEAPLESIYGRKPSCDDGKTKVE